ncbi:unnamed protein product, partial [Penicillium nalgiovense]
MIRRMLYIAYHAETMFSFNYLDNLCFADTKNNDSGIMPLDMEQEYVNNFDADWEILGGGSSFRYIYGVLQSALKYIRATQRQPHEPLFPMKTTSLSQEILLRTFLYSSLRELKRLVQCWNYGRPSYHS